MFPVYSFDVCLFSYWTTRTDPAAAPGVQWALCKDLLNKRTNSEAPVSPSPRCVRSLARSRRSLNICGTNELQVVGAEHVELWKPGQQMSVCQPAKAIPARAKGSGGEARPENGARSGEPRGGRCLRGARGGGAGRRATALVVSEAGRPGWESV